MHFVQKRRFPAPWRVVPIAGGFKVEDANGISIAYVYASIDKMTSASYSLDNLSVDEALRIAKGIAKLPELLKQR